MKEGARRRILVADADEGSRAQARLTLAGSSYDVVEAAATDEAIRSIASVLPDLILIDDGLPGAGGLRLTRSLKAQPETRDAIVILMYDRGEPVEDVDVDEAGVDAVLAKPFTSLGLLAKVDGLLDPGAPAARRDAPEGSDSP